MSESVRESLQAVMSAAKEPSSDVSDSTEADVAVEAAPDTAPTEAPAAAEGDTGDTGAGEAPAKQTQAERNRDKAGRYAKGTPAPKAGAVTQTKAAQTAAASPTAGTSQLPADGGDSSPAPTPAVSTPSYKPPQSWTPAAREALAKADPVIQKEVDRWNHDVQRVMREAAPHKQFVQEVAQLLGPIAQARGATPGQLIASYANVDRILSSGNQQAIGQALAQLIHTSGFNDFNGLVAALGQVPQQLAQHPPPQQIDPRAIAAQVRQEVENGFVQKQANRELHNFIGDAKNEFLRGEHGNAVLANMHARLAAAESAGESLELADAYEDAIWAVKGTRAILQQREQAKSAATAQAATARASAAGSSVRNHPASPVNKPASAGSLRADIMSSIERLNGR